MNMQVETVAKAAVEQEQNAVAASSTGPMVAQPLVERLVSGARDQGIAIDGEGGLLAQLTKLFESALEGEITDHHAKISEAL